MIELLIVMIVSGIVFLMAFSGLDILRKYSHLLHRRLTAESTLLYSHQALELLVEQSDSIRKEGQAFLFYANQTVTRRLVADPASASIVVLQQDSVIDEWFPQLLHTDCHLMNDTTTWVDSLFVTVTLGRDTLRLEYGLQAVRHTQLNVFSE